jgi:8-amino-3,8-dideoxy-alpha-D-manno-octulosonate transaminase
MATSESSREAALAIHGGPKAFPAMQGKRKPKIGVDEFMALAKRFGFPEDTLTKIRSLLSEDAMGRGPTLSRFATTFPLPSSGEIYERVARETFGTKYAIPASSGTGSLHSAFVAAGVGPGAEVIVPGIGFFATASAVVAAHGIPVFCDVDDSLHIDPKKIEAKITPRTVAIAPTCVMGGVPDLEPILEIARRHNLKVVEDCAQSPGAKYHGRHVGTWGDLGCFSIAAYKIVGGGEGGLILTNDERLYDRAYQVVESGGLWRPDRFAKPRYDGELFCGVNYRLSELESTVDYVQLQKMPKLVEQYNTNRQTILSRLKTYKEITPQKLNDVNGGVGYNIRFFPETIELGKKIAAALNAEGIGYGDFLWPASCAVRDENAPPDWHVYRYMFPVIMQTGATEVACPFSCSVYRERGGKAEYHEGDCPVAEDLFDRNIMVWLDPCYSEADCIQIADGINKVLSAYCTESADATSWL